MSYSRIFEYSNSANCSTQMNKMYLMFANVCRYSWVIPVSTPQVHCIYYVLKLTVLLYSCYTQLNNDYRVFSNEWTSRTSKLSVWACPKSYISNPETLNKYSNIYVLAKSIFTFKQISPKQIFIARGSRTVKSVYLLPPLPPADMPAENFCIHKFLLYNIPN